MGIFIDLTGQQFGRLTALRNVGKSRSGSMLWACACRCGNKSVASSGNLRSGHLVSCGCYHIERTKEVNSTHKKSKMVEYRLWSDMIMRCSDLGNKNYGGRGIKVCRRWRRGANGVSGFECFLADMGLRPGARTGRRAQYSIERKDNDGDYTPSNAHWATRREQVYNRSNTLRVEVNSKKLLLSEAVILAGGVVSPQLAACRLRAGWSGTRAVSTPPFYRGQMR